MSSAELYDPASGTFSATGSMITRRFFHTLTVLADARVLVAGNYGGDLPSNELYDPSSGTFSPTGNMITTRTFHTATLLPNGQVLITGGSNNAQTVSLASVEIYDSPSGTFSATGGMSTPRYGGTATLLADGRVLVAGGIPGGNAAIAVPSAELFDPVHPDLVARLWDELGKGLPADCRRVVFGTPALVRPDSGVVFGFAGGTHTYALRVPPDVREGALSAGATTVHRYPAYPELGIQASVLDLREIGDEWIFGGWFVAEPEWCSAAYEYAGG